MQGQEPLNKEDFNQMGANRMKNNGDRMKTQSPIPGSLKLGNEGGV
jgi:hypothetical protein